MLKLVFTDLDSTFLNSRRSFDANHFEHVLNIMDMNKIAFAACTGKQCERVEELFGQLSDCIWILGDSATRIKHAGEFVYQSLLPNELGMALINKLQKLSSNNVIVACTPTAAYTLDNISDDTASIIRNSYSVIHKVSNFETIHEDFVKITVYDATEQCIQTARKLSEFSDMAYIVASEPAWIDISNFNVHKGTTVNELQKILDIKKNETIAFGDGFNDLELFDAVGTSYAMGNGFDAVKEKADFITKTNDDNGVLSSIEKIIESNF